MARPRILQTRRWPENAEKALSDHFDVTLDKPRTDRSIKNP